MGRMSERSLFDRELSYPEGPGYSNESTSRDAAAKIKDHVSRLAAQVLLVIERPGGATCWEVETCAGLSHQTASARIRELALFGAIQDSGAKRKTSSRRDAIVWVKKA